VTVTFDVYLPLVLFFALLVLIAAVGWWRAQTRVGRRNRARQRIAQRAERQAERVLHRNGYQIVERQVIRRWSMRIDNRDVLVHSRADLLVSRHGEHFIAEVKTGSKAPDPTLPATRRQLLEYLLAFQVSGVLLVDMVQRQIHEVRFSIH